MLKICTILFLLLLTHSLSAQEDFNITKISNAPFSPIALDFEIRGDYAYCADIYGLSVLDLSDPENPDKVGYCQTLGEASRITIHGDYAYVSDSGYGIAVIDISDHENPEVVS